MREYILKMYIFLFLCPKLWILSNYGLLYFKYLLKQFLIPFSSG